MTTTPYYAERARRWAAEVRGLRGGSLERGAAIRKIAERCYTTVDTVRAWIREAEKETK